MPNVKQGHPPGIKQYHLYDAVFSPRSDDQYVLRDEVKPFIGKQFTVEAAWIIRPDETSLYQNEWAMWIQQPHDFPRKWIASGDLEIVGQDKAPIIEE